MIADLLLAAGVPLDTRDEGELACAAAAAGVFAASGIAPTPTALAPTALADAMGGYGSDLNPVPWRLGRGTALTGGGAISARVLARVWDSAGASRARLMVDFDVARASGDALAGMLCRAVPLGSLSVVDRSGGPSGHWDWPLRIGVLGDRAGLALARGLDRQSMLRRGLAKVVVLGADGDDCDLLLLPEDLGTALSHKRLLVLPPDGAIGAAVVLGGAGGASVPDAVGLISDLRGRLHAEAVALMHVDGATLGQWTDQLVRALSHDKPLDVALRTAGKLGTTIAGQEPTLGMLGDDPTMPLLITGPDLLGYAHLLRARDGIVRRLRALPRATITLPQSAVKALRLEPGAPLAIPAEALAETLETRPSVFMSEGDDGTLYATVDAATAKAEAPPERRFADVAVCEGERFRPEGALPDTTPLEPGRTYVLRFAFVRDPVGIGAEGAREPVEPLPGDADLLVTTTPIDKGLTVPEPTRYIRMRRGEDSAPADFCVKIDANTNAVCRIEIRVYYRLNLLEYLVVSLPVGPGQKDPHPPARIAQQKQHRDPCGELDKLYRPRAINIHVSNQDRTYRIAVAIERSDSKEVQAEAFTRITAASELERSLVKVRNFWIACALDSFGKAVDAPDGTAEQVLGKMARVGRDLWSLLFRRGRRDGAMDAVQKFLLDNAPPEGALVQVTLERSAHDFVFPWSLLYPGEADPPDPSAFWGVRYVIEQQFATGDVAEGDEDATAPRPMTMRFGLHRRFKQAPAHEAFILGLGGHSGGGLDVGTPIENPKALMALLSKDCPAELLYIYSHGYTPFAFPAWLDALKRALRKESKRGDEALASMLEVLRSGDFDEDDCWIELTQGKLRLSDLWAEEFGLPRRPVVFLNMCRSAQLMPGFTDSFVDLFLVRGGARAVLGTECPVDPGFADLMGREMLPRLLSGVPLGEALRQVRKDLIGTRRNPLGLAYTLWGRATAHFEPPALPGVAPAAQERQEERADA